MANTEVTQARIEAIVRANPGIHTAQLAMVLGLAWNTTMHHVRSMDKSGRLTVHKIDGKLRIFDRKRGAFRNKVAAAVLQDPQNRKVAVYVMQNPGKSQRELAKALDLSTTAVHRRLGRLEEAGLLQRLAAGRCTLVHATDDLPDAFVESGFRTPPAAKAHVEVAPADPPEKLDAAQETIPKTTLARLVSGTMPSAARMQVVAEAETEA